jgi:hypothetical protein
VVLGGLTRVRRDAKGNRLRPCKQSTVRTRRAELKAAARMAVRQGVPIETLTSLAALVHPDVAELVIDTYWKADGPEPGVYTIDLGWKFLSIARAMGCLAVCGRTWRLVHWPSFCLGFWGGRDVVNRR